MGGVDVRGSAPGTRETDLLQLTNLAEKVHAVLLSGGSAFGLNTATGDRKAFRTDSANLQELRQDWVTKAVIDLVIGTYRLEHNEVSLDWFERLEQRKRPVIPS